MRPLSSLPMTGLLTLQEFVKQADSAAAPPSIEEPLTRPGGPDTLAASFQQRTQGRRGFVPWGLGHSHR